MAVWKFNENSCDFDRVPTLIREASPDGLIHDDGIYLVVNRDPDLVFGCIMYLDEGGGSTRLISPEESTFTVAGAEFYRDAYVRHFFLQDSIELRVDKRLAELMFQVRQQGRMCE